MRILHNNGEHINGRRLVIFVFFERPLYSFVSPFQSSPSQKNKLLRAAQINLKLLCFHGKRKKNLPLKGLLKVNSCVNGIAVTNQQQSVHVMNLSGFGRFSFSAPVKCYIFCFFVTMFSLLLNISQMNLKQQFDILGKVFLFLAES